MKTPHLHAHRNAWNAVQSIGASQGSLVDIGVRGIVSNALRGWKIIMLGRESTNAVNREIAGTAIRVK